MTSKQWEAFCNFRIQMKNLCQNWLNLASKLAPLQQEASKKDTPPYPLQTAVVYNTAYDSVTINDQIRLIVIGDNPGKEEQLEKNRKYLVGQSGRIAEGFFKRHPEFNIDFRKNAIIVNKTPIHTAKTAHLRHLAKKGDSSVRELLMDSQLKMARLTAELHQKMIEGTDCLENAPQLWLVGYTELKDRGIFVPYREELKASYLPKNTNAWSRVFVFQHFSMNCFTKDLGKRQAETGSNNLVQLVKDIGTDHKNEIFSI